MLLSIFQIRKMTVPMRMKPENKMLTITQSGHHFFCRKWTYLGLMARLASFVMMCILSGIFPLCIAAIADRLGIPAPPKAAKRLSVPMFGMPPLVGPACCGSFLAATDFLMLALSTSLTFASTIFRSIAID